MGGGKKHKLDKAFKQAPLRDKFDKATQERTLAAQKAAAQRRAQEQQRKNGGKDDSFRQQQAALLARRTGVKKAGRKTLPLAAASFNLAPAAVAAGDEGGVVQLGQLGGGSSGHRLKYSADRLLQGEKAKAPPATPADAAPDNRFALLQEEEEHATLKLQPSLLGAYVPFAAPDYSDDANL